MPKRFSFFIDDEKVFSCPLKSWQCTEHKRDGSRCSRKVVIGSPVCWQHLGLVYRLTAKPSTITGAGKGLFAHDPESDIVFKKNEQIITYTGDVITNAELQERYPRKKKFEPIAPYTIKLKQTRYVDSACDRGIGSIVNNASNSNANAKIVSVFNANPQYIYIKAIKNIRHGEEIFASYGPAYNKKNMTNKRVRYHTK